MTDVVLVAVIAATPPTIVALGAFVIGLRNGQKADNIHVLMNSRLTELLAAIRIASHAEGVADEQARQKDTERTSR